MHDFFLASLARLVYMSRAGGMGIFPLPRVVIFMELHSFLFPVLCLGDLVLVSCIRIVLSRQLCSSLIPITIAWSHDVPYHGLHILFASVTVRHTHHTLLQHP